MSSLAGEGNTVGEGLQIPGIASEDKSEYIAVHAVECVQCHQHSEAGDEEQAYGWQNKHYDKTDHVTYWHYRLERSRGRLVHPAKGHW